jgi:hypothetical protein
MNNKKFLIINNGRCGSTHLASILMNLKNFVVTINDGIKIRELYSILERYDKKNNGLFVGAKVLFHYFQTEYDESKLQDYCYIYLKRRNEFNTAISHITARYRVNKGFAANYRISDSIFDNKNFTSLKYNNLERNLIVQEYFNRIGTDIITIEFFKKHKLNYIEIYYEDLCSNNLKTINKITKFLNYEFIINLEDLKSEFIKTIDYNKILKNQEILGAKEILKKRYSIEILE